MPTATNTWDDASQSPVGDLSQVAAALAADFAADRTAGLCELVEFVRVLKGMGALNSLDSAAFQTALAPLATNGDDNLSDAGNGNFYLRGLGNDALDGGSGNGEFLYCLFAPLLNSDAGNDSDLWAGGWQHEFVALHSRHSGNFL